MVVDDDGDDDDSRDIYRQLHVGTTLPLTSMLGQQ